VAIVPAAIEIPELSSLILKHDRHAPLAGFDTVPRADWSPLTGRFSPIRRNCAQALSDFGKNSTLLHP
jgi:cytochrome d ubiquinol oxidase subunit I